MKSKNGLATFGRGLASIMLLGSMIGARNKISSGERRAQIQSGQSYRSRVGYRQKVYHWSVIRTLSSKYRPHQGRRECERRLRQEMRNIARQNAREARERGYPLCAAEWKNIGGAA